MSNLMSLITGTRIEAELDGLVERLRRSVVVVRDGGRGAGSGVIWASNGTIVTNHHVASGERAEVVLSDGRAFAGTVRQSDPRRDLAVIDIPAIGLPAVTVGDSEQLRVGELVFAVGNPLGLTGAVTAGIVSGIGGQDRRGRRGERLIQADVSLAPGNSGGLLARADGSVVGINAMFRLPGMALAVPSSAVVALLAGEGNDRAYLGVTLSEVPLPAAWVARRGEQRAGLLITSVSAASPADHAGLLPGDVIVALEGDLIDSIGGLGEALAATAPGETLELGILRGGVRVTVRVETGRALEEAA